MPYKTRWILTLAADSLLSPFPGSEEDGLVLYQHAASRSGRRQSDLGCLEGSKLVTSGPSLPLLGCLESHSITSDDASRNSRYVLRRRVACG